MARVDRAAKGGEGCGRGTASVVVARLTSTGVPCKTSKALYVIELSTLGLGTTAAAPPMPDGPPMVDADLASELGSDRL
jgi:hypothetical protein